MRYTPREIDAVQEEVARLKEELAGYLTRPESEVSESAKAIATAIHLAGLEIAVGFIRTGS